jgi:ribonuclease E
VACVEEPPPRSFVEFMDDSLAREGVLARCNTDREATAYDVECVNARRAAAAIAAQDEPGKRERLEAQSEARLRAARQRADAQLVAERQAALAAEAEREQEYEAQFEEAQPVEATTAAAAQQSPLVSPAAVYPAPVEAAPVEAAPVEAAPVVAAPAESTTPLLEPVTLPSSVRTPLTTVSLPRGVKPMEYAPPEPELEEIVVPNRLKTVD